jgi:hypothetical protein
LQDIDLCFLICPSIKAEIQWADSLISPKIINPGTVAG